MPVEEWASAAFHDDALAWVGEQLAARGLALVGDWEQPHARVVVDGDAGREQRWSVLVQGERRRHAARAVTAVPARRAAARSRPRGARGGRGARLVAVERRRPDAAYGARGRPVVGAVGGIVAEYAEAQLTLADSRDAVLACGVEERSPRTLPAQARALLEELGSTPEERGRAR